MPIPPFVRQSESTPREPLAVIGIGCRLPGAIDSPSSYWTALLAGRDAICEVPADRWKHSRFHDPNPEKFGAIRNARGGFIDGVDQFDADFFGYFPTEAARLDPQQRLLLEVAHEAMEDAGIRRDQLDGSRTAVFVGAFMYDYLCMQTASDQRDEINPYVAMGTGLTSLANRISYNFNLKGPSVSLDTACSSSLVAVHLACRSLWGGEADMAIAGGVNLMLRPESSIMLSKAGFLNPDQYCKAFDASANGYVRGEGVGVVILKPLSKAMSDGDAIYALVRGTAVNQDGYMPEGFTVPSLFSQVAMLRAAYSEAGVDPNKVDFIEAHGTGTSVGDPIECLALGTVLGRDRAPGHQCLLGSVKTNLGHLEGAAGIAGFIKAVLTAHHGIAPPNLHFKNPNPNIDFEELKLVVPTRPTLLERHGLPLTIGVNSFGAGGTNAHVVLQEHSERPRTIAGIPRAKTRPATLYMLSAAHRDSLRSLAIAHADFLNGVRPRLDDAAFSAFTRRSRYEHVLAVVGASAKEIADRLRKFGEGQVDPATLATRIVPKKRAKIAFIFSGQGGQWLGMGRQLMEREAVFLHAIEDIDSCFMELAGWSLLEELRAEDGASRIDHTVVVQPAVMAIQIALFKLYEHYGIRPRAVMGHSIGEVAAAYAAGALSLEDAVRVIYHRSQAQSQASGKGGMLAVGLSLDDARKLIEGRDGRVSIGAVNGPEMVTLSGDAEPLAQIAHLLEARGVFNRPVRVQVAYHSHHMEPILDRMRQTLAGVHPGAASTPLYSTVTGRRETGLHLDAEYWCKNARDPVFFTDALNAMLADGYDTYLEIGPHPLLIHGSEALFQKAAADAIIGPSMTRREPEVMIFLQSLARLAARGAAPDTTALFGSERRFVRLPKYAWQHSRYWFETSAQAEARQGRFDHPFLKRQTQLVTEDGLAVWDANVSLQKFPYLHDHQVDGSIIFPATGHIELAWAVASEQYRHEAFFLEDLQFDSALLIPDNSRHPLEVRLEIVSSEGDYFLCSRSADAPVEGGTTAELPWTRHSSGRINTTHDRFEKSSATLEALRERFYATDEQSVERFYDTLRASGLEYGEKFRCIQQLWHRGHETIARVQLADDLVYEAKRNAFHPALLDACLHAVFADSQAHGDPKRVFLPARIERVRFHGQPAQNLWSYVKVSRNDEHYLCSDMLIFNEDGSLVAEFVGVQCKRLAGSGSRPADSLYEGCYEYRWLPAPRDPALHGRVFDCTTAVLVSCGKFALVEDLGTRLEAENIKPVVLQPGLRESLDDLLRDVPLDRRTLVVFVGLGADGREWRGLSNCPQIPLFLRVAQALQRREGVPRLFVVTAGAAGVASDTHLDLGQATLHGMCRVIHNECPNIPVTMIDLSEGTPAREVELLFEELLHSRRDRDESEIALRGEERLVRQLAPIDRESAEQAAASEEAGVGGAYRADLSEPGVLDQIVYRRLAASEPDADEVEIAVQAAALNFKDVMNAMGMLPAQAVAGGLASDRLGLEVAGRVTRVGARVTDIKPEDKVIARVADGFSGRVIAPAHCVVQRPKSLTNLEAAAVPVVFVTAWYALVQLARLGRGETVLIHSAAGGVGGAAIQLAQRAGATIIATAGTKEKRAWLRQLGVPHVFDSRSLEFFNQVMEVTKGRGVDVVLNSLTGRFISQSLKCLAPFGRFIEIGKADIYRNSKLNLERLGENISYFVVDVDRLAVQRPDLHRQALTEVIGMLERGELRPLEVTEFPVGKLPEAMKFMTRAAYRGKIVLNMDGERVRTLPPRQAALSSDRTYMVSGGASGFGLEIARWMVERGARHLVLLSRSGCKTDADREAVEAMMEDGVEVLLAQADVTDPKAITRLLGRIRSTMPPLAGIVHGAAVLDDASLASMDMARFARVFNPKAQGAWNLHHATEAAGVKLDFFVMLSSISSIFGLYGQTNYAAANYFQDALAQYRRLRGLPATSVNLGVLGEYAGMSRSEADANDVIGLLESHGMLVMSLSEVLAKVEAAIVQQPVQRMTARFNWTKFRTAYPHLVRNTRFLDLMSDSALARGTRPGGANLRATLATLEPAQRHTRLQEELAGSLARILDVTPDQLDVTTSIDNLGLDSLMLTQLRNRILRSLDVNLPLVKLLKGPSIATLTTDLLSLLDNRGSETAGAKDGAQSAATFTVADLEGVRVLNPWLIRGRTIADLPMRLICFHSMGVGASLFTRYLLNPPMGYDVLAVQTPGRENRRAEAVVESVDALADQIVPQLLPFLDKPTVIWGHSNGGIVANEVIRRLRDRHQWEPTHFLITGTIAPQLIHLWQKREVMLKAMVADNSPEYLVSLSRYVDDPEFLKSIVPLMRRDWPLLKNYRFQQLSPLSCPITAFSARQDDMVYTDEIREWSKQTRGHFELIEVDGDHWFLNRNRDRIITVLQDVFARVTSSGRGHNHSLSMAPHPVHG